MKKLLVAAASTAALFAGLPAMAQMPAPAQMNAADPAPTQAMPYVAKAGASDLFEIQSSQLALSQGQSGKVKSFAQMMVKDHMTTTKEVMAAAQAAGMTPPPPMLEPAQADMIRQLQSLNGDAFDQAYIAQQKTAHEMALTLHQTYAAQGDTPRLKKVAAKAVPIIKRHIVALNKM